MNKLSEKDKNDWIALCNYIKYTLLEYSKEMKFPKYMALRLNGLVNGNFIANNNITPNAHYTYEEILMTCKVCSVNIKNYLENNMAKIQNEQHKINLIMMFIENEINDVVIRMNAQNKLNAEAEKFTLDSLNTIQADYKTDNIDTKDRFNELW